MTKAEIDELLERLDQHSSSWLTAKSVAAFIRELIAERDAALAAAVAVQEAQRCPNCPDQGWYDVETGGCDSDGENDTRQTEQVQCEFCYTEPNSLFNVSQSPLAAGRALIERVREDAVKEAIATMNLTSDHNAALAGARDWTEDFTQENGDYTNLCAHCWKPFRGYKRRTICKVCAAPPTPPQPEDIEALRRDAERWHEYKHVMEQVTRPDALHIQLRAHRNGEIWGVQCVLDTQQFGERSVLGIKAIGLAAEEQAKNLFAAIDAALAARER